jgi:hypothetical protein
VAMAGGALVDDASAGDLQRGVEGCGPVPDVVVGMLLGPPGPDPADRLGPLQDDEEPLARSTDATDWTWAQHVASHVVCRGSAEG